MVVRHLPTEDMIGSWPRFTAETPLRVLVSGCVAGLPTGYDGSTYGVHTAVRAILALPNVNAVAFCPEDFSFGTPRALCDIHGGDGHDVLAGRARVLTSSGEDWTEGMLAGAREMLKRAKSHAVRVAILMDISAACGSQVIYAGARPNAPYRAAHGVCAALLIENGIPVVSQRDYRTLALLRSALDPHAAIPLDVRDHHETEWYRSHFAT